MKSRLSPPLEAARWEKGHWRIERRCLKRVAVTPEQIGLVGCWQVIAVRREVISMQKGVKKKSDETLYYVTSIAVHEKSDEEIAAIIRGHWSAIENGTHYCRDVSLGEDACRIANRKSAHAMATLRNLAIGAFEIRKSQGLTTADGLKSWCRRMTGSEALKILRK